MIFLFTQFKFVLPNKIRQIINFFPRRNLTCHSHPPRLKYAVMPDQELALHKGEDILPFQREMIILSCKRSGC